jgi:hypothetical protein
MTRISQEQISEIMARYSVGPTLDRVRRLLNLLPEARAEILRYHETRPVWDEEELEYRGALDEVLGLVSAVEVIAIAAGELPDLPHNLALALQATLEDAEVQQYYEVYYPIALPTLFREQLDALKQGISQDPSLMALARIDTGNRNGLDDAGLACLISFFELDSRLTRGIALPFFLDLMDDYVMDGVSMDDVLDIVEDPDRYEAVALMPTSKGTKFEKRGVQGLEDFLSFSADLKRLLSRLQERPMLRAAIWLHYCYWFGNGSNTVRRAAHELRKRLKNWSQRAQSEEEVGIIDRETEAITETLIDLTDWKKYAGPLVEAAAPRLRHWASAQEAA